MTDSSSICAYSSAAGAGCCHGHSGLIKWNDRPRKGLRSVFHRIPKQTAFKGGLLSKDSCHRTPPSLRQWRTRGLWPVHEYSEPLHLIVSCYKPTFFVDNKNCKSSNMRCTIKLPVVKYLSYPLMERRVRWKSPARCMLERNPHKEKGISRE